jgi:hypothetical protein
MFKDFRRPYTHFDQLETLKLFIFIITWQIVVIRDIFRV